MDSNEQKQPVKHKKKNPLNPLAKKYGHHVYKKTKESKSDLKRSIRDNERSLKRNLSATQRQELERRAKALQLKLKEKGQEEIESRLYEQYKYVRFVETKKLHRKITQTTKQIEVLSSEGKDNSKLQSSLESLKMQLLYVSHYPCDTKYISLFPKEPSAPESHTAVLQKQIMDKIQQAHEAGLLEKGYLLRMNNDQDSDTLNETNATADKEKKQIPSTDLEELGKDVHESKSKSGKKYKKQKTISTAEKPDEFFVN